MDQRVKIGILLVYMCLLPGCSMFLYQNGYIQKEQVDIAVSAVPHTNEKQTDVMRVRMSRCVDRLNSQVKGIKNKIALRMALTIGSGVISAASGLANLTAPEGSLDLRISTGVLSSISGLAALTSGLINESATEKVFEESRKHFDSARQKIDAATAAGTALSGTDMAIVLGELEQCGSYSGASVVQKTDDAPAGSHDNISTLRQDLKSAMSTVKDKVSAASSAFPQAVGITKDKMKTFDTAAKSAESALNIAKDKTEQIKNALGPAISASTLDLMQASEALREYIEAQSTILNKVDELKKLRSDASTNCTNDVANCKSQCDADDQCKALLK